VADEHLGQTGIEHVSFALIQEPRRIRPATISTMDGPRTLLIVVVLAGLAWLLLLSVLWLHRPSRELVGPVVLLVPDIVRLVRSLLADAAIPKGPKIALGGLLLYLLSPIDLVPDFVPVLGAFDDLIVGGLVLRWVGRRIGPDDLWSHWSGTEEGFALLRRLLGT
jgi:uncharacterized membrane protein YkvA (DUF1232 family)